MNKTYIITISTLAILLTGTGIYAYKSGQNTTPNQTQSLNSSSGQISSISNQTPKPVVSSQISTVVSSVTPTPSSQITPVSTTSISSLVSSSTVALVSVTPASIPVVSSSSSAVKVNILSSFINNMSDSQKSYPITDILFDCIPKGKFEPLDCNVLDQNNNKIYKLETKGVPKIMYKNSKEIRFYLVKDINNLCNFIEYSFTFEDKKFSIIKDDTPC